MGKKIVPYYNGVDKELAKKLLEGQNSGTFLVSRWSAHDFEDVSVFNYVDASNQIKHQVVVDQSYRKTQYPPDALPEGTCYAKNLCDHMKEYNQRYTNPLQLERSDIDKIKEEMKPRLMRVASSFFAFAADNNQKVQKGLEKQPEKSCVVM